MTTPDRDPVLDAFDRRLAAIERLIPARPPMLGQTVAQRPIKVVGGSALQRKRRAESSRNARLVLAPIGIAAAVVVALLGVGLLNGSADGPGAVSSSSPSAAPAALCAGSRTSGSPQPVPSACLYRSSAFQPPVELRLSAGWALVVDAARELSIQTDLSASQPEVGTLTVATLDNVSKSPCVASGVAGPARPWTPAAPADGPQALMDWIESDSGVPHSPPSLVTIDGQAGLETTLSPGIGSLQSCGGTAFLADLGTPGGFLRIRENEAMRLAAIVVGDKTIIFVTQVPRAVLLGDLETKADAILGTVTFR